MADADDFGTRARARARALAAGFGAAGRRAGIVLPAGWRAAGERYADELRKLAALEVAPGRLVPWLPVAFGFGIALYFTADREPAVWAPLMAAAIGVVLAIRARKTALAFALTLAFAAIALGFAIATVRTAAIAHPVLPHAVTADLTGFVEVREERARTDRIVLRVYTAEGIALERVRVAVKKGSAPAVGEFVALKARLTPPLQPLRPGGYDFARDMYFQRIGASGYVLGQIKPQTPPIALSWRLRFAAAIDHLREAIDDRIREILPGDRGAIASALITGKRDTISPPVNEAMYVSSLAHVLSISGYHMAVVAGIVFFIFRAALALIPSITNRYSIKKWSALPALAAAAFYLVLSGAEVATQRSFIMVAVVLIGVMCDRPALTLRTLTVAALIILALAPEAVVHPGFQMSFAATLALVAAYAHGLPWGADADSSLSARMALWGGRQLAGLVMASLVAGLATTLYAAFHFHRLAPYGVLANLLAMPVVSLGVMPAGILGGVLMPFGFDAPFWRLMGLGIDWMIFVAQWVASLPGAVGRIAAFGIGPLLLGTAGLLIVCLLRTRLRWSGAALGAIAVLWAATSERPNIYAGSDGRAAAVRGANGRLGAMINGRDTFAVREWLSADADPRQPDDPSLKDNMRCDNLGCIGRLRDGRLVALTMTPQALREDCERASIIVTALSAPANCKALVIDRKVVEARGAVALFGDQLVMLAARPIGYARPWTPQAAVPALQRRDLPDATPRTGDLGVDDQ